MPVLTGIRAIAAYMVCFFHYNPFGNSPHSNGWRQLAFAIFNELHTGVTIFFVLSGFLICYRYYEVKSQINWLWFKRYFQNRLARIYPMYFLLTLITFILFELNDNLYELVKTYGHHPIGERLSIIMLNLTLLKGFFNQYKFSGVAQAWSLTVEECFYACVPFYIFYLRYKRRSIISLTITTLIIAAFLWQTLGKLHFHGLFDTAIFMLNFTFFGRCIEFFAGIALALFVLEQRKRNLQGTLPTRRGSWLTIIGITCFASAIVTMALIYIHLPADITTSADYNGNSKDTYAGIIINNLILPIFITLLLYGLLTEYTWIQRILSTDLFALLGKSSYVFYLIHIGIVNVLIKNYIAHNAVLQFVLLNFISIILFKYIETPLHKWLKPK